MSASNEFEISIRLHDKYQFILDFGEFGQFMTDEPEPLGDGEGPNPARVLAAACANCLAASLVFSIRKFKEDPGELSAKVRGQIGRVDQRLRIENLAVDLHLGTEAASIAHLERALAQFEDFCVVTQSIRSGIPVDVQVFDGSGVKVK